MIVALRLPALAFSLAAVAILGASLSAGKPVFAADTGAKGIDATMMDKAASPCADFFRYACGGWIDGHPIPADESSWRVDQLLGDLTLAKLRDILEKAAAKPTPETAKIGDFYTACMDEAKIDTLNLAPIKLELAQINALTSKDQLPSLLAHLHRSGVRALFRFGVSQDAKDAETEMVVIDAGGLGLPDRAYYTKTDSDSVKLRAEYTGHVALMLAFAREPAATAQADSFTALRLETKLAEGSLDRVARRDPQRIYHRMTRAELDHLTPSFAWDAYFNALAAPELTTLDVAEPDFMRAVDKLIRETPLSDIKAYLRWKLIDARAEWLPKRFVLEDFAFGEKRLRGTTELKPRWKRCVMAADWMLMDDLGRAYVANAFPAEAKTRTIAMVDAMVAAFRETLEALDWMTPETRAKALNKLMLVRHKVGYPDRWKDYGPLTITRDDALGNAARASEFYFNTQMAKIGKPVDHGEWMFSPSTVNAYYDSSMNDINLPAGILQPPFFSPEYDDAVNFGATGGGTMGHELTHGFDDEGRQYDGRGNMVDWWTKQDATRFAERAKCVVDQFASYPLTPGGPKIDGELTLGENVADLGGVRLGYVALMNALKTKGRSLDEKIGGFTAAQRYFLGYAQSWCGSTRPEAAKLLAGTDPHAPAEFRVNGIVSDLAEFRAAFSCKAGDAMAPARMCRVW